MTTTAQALEALRDALPKVGEPDSTWCVLRGGEIRAALQHIESTAAEIARLQAECEALRKDAEWRPIETAPKDGTRIIVSCQRLGVIGPANWDDNRFNRRPIGYWTHWGEQIWGNRSVRDDQPTHWKPLPAPPASLSTSTAPSGAE